MRLSLRFRLLAVAGLCSVLLTSESALAQRSRRQQQQRAEKPAPDMGDVAYGPHARNVLDLWKAKADAPTPLVVFIHGGGFRGGSKEALSPALLAGLLDKGISVMAINYRLSPEVKFPDHYMDCARAIQFSRLNSKDWNIDPQRIGASGGSAGAGTSLWLGFHDDLADPASEDPVLRNSTRLACMAVNGAQSSYDPRVIRDWVGDSAARHPALEGFYGLASDQLDTPAAHEKYVAASPITHLTKDDPPVYAFYREGRVLPPDARPGQGIHHINFGLKLKEQMDPLGIECIVRHADEGALADPEMIEFFVAQLITKTETPARPTVQPRRENPAFAPVTDDPALPRVLLIGDSISIGYTLPVRDALTGVANVHRIPTNGGPTKNGLANIDEWLGDSKWDVIHFNWGLHDLKFIDTEGKLDDASAGTHQIPVEEYETNLAELVTRLKATGAKLIWCSTTPVPDGASGRKPGDELLYNEAAARVMEQRGVPTNDLYTFAHERLADIQLPANVHFSDAGSEVLGEQVAETIRKRLEE